MRTVHEAVSDMAAGFPLSARVTEFEEDGSYSLYHLISEVRFCCRSQLILKGKGLQGFEYQNAVIIVDHLRVCPHSQVSSHQFQQDTHLLVMILRYSGSFHRHIVQLLKLVP